MSEEKRPDSPFDENEEPQPISMETIEIGNLLWGHSREQYSVPRKYQEYFGDMLEELGFDRYGLPLFTEDRTFQNDVFAVRPYWWGDDDSPEAELPNFEYYPMHFKLHWYKYPLRDSYSNLPVQKEMLEEIFEGCKKSLRKEKIYGNK